MRQAIRGQKIAEDIFEGFLNICLSILLGRGIVIDWVENYILRYNLNYGLGLLHVSHGFSFPCLFLSFFSFSFSCRLRQGWGAGLSPLWTFWQRSNCHFFIIPFQARELKKNIYQSFDYIMKSNIIFIGLLPSFQQRGS